MDYLYFSFSIFSPLLIPFDFIIKLEFPETPIYNKHMTKCNIPEMKGLISMDSKKLEILMTAADLGSFTKTSEVVGYTQSGLTHMMDSLEKEIGFPLLQRNHNGIQLTEQGLQLMPAIREFLQANANLENQIRAITESKTEVIRIAAYSSIAMHWMPEILYRFRRLCPDVNVDLRMVDILWSPLNYWKKGRLMLSLQVAKTAAAANGFLYIMNKCMPFCQRIILWREGLISRFRNFPGRTSLCLMGDLISM